MNPTLPARRVLVAGAALTLAFALGGCSAVSGLLGGSTATRDEDTNEIAEEGSLNVFELAVGDCVVNPPDGEVQSVDVVPCDEPHDSEVFHEVTMPDGEWPGQTAVDTAAEEGCLAEFESFIGTPWDESAVYVQFITPTEQTWTAPEYNDRLISCLAYQVEDPADPYSATVPTTGTLKDSGL